MKGDRTVIDFSGVAIGTATDTGRLYDFGGVCCGTVSAQGDAYDHGRVHIGRCREQETGEPAPLAGAGVSGV